MTEAWRVAGESREKQSRFVFEIFKQGKRPCASKDAKLYENTLHYEWVFIVSFEFAFHVGERQGCSSRVAQALENRGISASSGACGKFQQAFAQAFMRLM